MMILKQYLKQSKWLVVTWILICALLWIQLTINKIVNPDAYTILYLISIPLTRMFVGTILIWVLLLPAYNYFNQFNLTIKIISALVVGLVFSLSLVFYNGLLRDSLFGTISFQKLYDETVQRAIISLYHNITYYFMFVAILIAEDYFQDKIIAVRKREKIAKELTQTKLHVLRNQLQPHFLFNALHSISSIIDESKETAQDMIADISHLLRTSLQTDYAQKVTLKNELALLNTYLNIEKRRFEHQLKTEESIDSQTLDHMLPPFLLQPMADNAIKHGFNKGVTSLKIKTEAFIEDQNMIIRIANNGAILNGAHQGIGIKNIQERLLNAFGENGKYTLTQKGEWVVNEINIPL